VKNNKVVSCLSPCMKETFPSPYGFGKNVNGPGGKEMCCPGNNVQGCRSGPVVNTQFVQMIHQKCPTAYSYAYDDVNGNHNCPTQTGFDVEFCPVAAALAYMDNSSIILPTPTPTPTPTPLLVQATAGSGTPLAGTSVSFATVGAEANASHPTSETSTGVWIIALVCSVVGAASLGFASAWFLQRRQDSDVFVGTNEPDVQECDSGEAFQTVVVFDKSAKLPPTPTAHCSDLYNGVP